MSSTLVQRPTVPLLLTGPQGMCPVCEAHLPIKQQRKRTVHGLDESLLVTLRDTGCANSGCPRAAVRLHPFREVTLALSNHQYGLDVVCAIGKMRFQATAVRKRIPRAQQRRLGALHRATQGTRAAPPGRCFRQRKGLGPRQRRSPPRRAAPVLPTALHQKRRQTHGSRTPRPGSRSPSNRGKTARLRTRLDSSAAQGPKGAGRRARRPACSHGVMSSRACRRPASGTRASGPTGLTASRRTRNRRPSGLRSPR